MEAKRRRVEGPSGQSPGSSGQGKSVKVTKMMLTSEDEKTRLAAVQELKKQITNKTSVKNFMNENDPEQLFKTVIEMFVKKTAELVESGTLFPPELKFVIGILANCCFYTTEACLEIKQNHIRFNAYAVKIADSTLTPTDCKYSLMRLIGNMCAHKEAALSISTSSLLLEQIVKQLDSEHSLTVSQAMRCLGMLTNASLWRPVLQANVAFNLGKLIGAKSGKVVEDAVSLLLLLSRRNANEVGMQVTRSDCVEKLLELLFQGNETVQQLVVRLCGASPDVRDKFGEKGTIQKIADNEEHHTQECCNLLSTFAQDAWGRATLRTSGALDVLLDRLCKECPLSEKMTLIRSLKHFIHDTAGIAHMAASRQFVNMVVKDVKEFVQENGSVCKPTVPDDDDFYRPDSPLLMEIETSMKEDTSRKDQPERLHKDFFSLWGYSASSPTRSMSSGNLSPHSSGAASPIWMTSPESASRLSLAGSYQKSEQQLDPDDGESSVSENDKFRRAIVDSELWLICQQTQEDSNIPRLIRVDLIDAILDYLSTIPRPDYRVARALRRLAEFREGLDKMIEMEFHTRVLNKLCDTPCRILRNARRCNRCEKCGTFGREVLKEFASHVDSDFGHSYVSRLISSPDFETRVKAAIAKVALIRNRGPMDRRLSIGHKNAMEILVDSLKDLISRDNFEEVVDQPTYPGGPPLCAQIIGALSTLIPLSKIREMFDIDAVFVRSELVECKISPEAPENPTDYLKFEEDGKCLAYISLKDACENSGYFQGMFSANLLEKTSGQRVFKFDPEQENCSSDDFTRFLHWLSGCRDECTTRVKTISTCLAMIELSDRYLCRSLSDWVCGPHGPTSRLISGLSLQHLFPAALSTNMHPRFLSACFATLMRYANAEDIVNVMLVIHKLPVLQETFLSKLRSFVADCTR